MAILSPPRALPGLLASLMAHLDRRGPASRAALWDRFVPPPIRNGEGPRHTFDDTVGVGRTLGLFVEQGEQLGLSPVATPAWASAASPDAFLADWVLDPERTGPDPMDRSAPPHPSDDLARALAWFLEVDPTDAPLYDAKAVNRQHSPAVRLQALNGELSWAPADAAWNAFARWALYLGFARQWPVDGRSSGVVPDVHRAVRRVLPDIGVSTATPIGQFLETLGQRIPVLCGATAERARERMGLTGDREVKPCLAFALERLVKEGVVALTREGDADEWTFRFGRFVKVAAPDGDRTAQYRSYTHVLAAAREGAA